MPKIEVLQDALFSFIGKKMNHDALEDLLVAAKAELDEVTVDQESGETGVFKIELNDTNRPDLWSAAGLGRQLGIYMGGEIPFYPFFSSEEETKDHSGRVVTVDPALKDIRPYITAFAVTGKPVEESALKDIIQSQEKLCWNFGQKRSSIAMGVYRSDLFDYPVRYTAADPDKTKFVPLQMERELSLREILHEHPKGKDFGWIVEDFSKYPFLTGKDEAKVLSFPPIINSATVGAVQLGDERLFVELTGTDMDSLLLATSIVACDLHDQGYQILPVKIEYPYETKYGREMVTPYYFQTPLSVEMSEAERFLGEEISPEEALEVLRKMGCRGSVSNSTVRVRVPEYRNDFLHPVDIIEDIMIGRGVNTFEPVMPGDFTIGRLSLEEHFARKVKDVMVGLGFQEMIYNYLGSGKDFIDKMEINGESLVRIANPMTENYEYVRNSILPALLSSESVSAHAVYPHHIFEIGKVAFKNDSENYGSSTKNFLGFLSADSEAGFNLVNSHVSALMFYLIRDYTLEETEDPRFIPGRSAEIYITPDSSAGQIRVGVFGEIHPQVLENWGIQVPCTACEIDLDLLL